MAHPDERRRHWEFTIDNCTQEAEIALKNPKILESVQYLAFFKESGTIQGFVSMQNCVSKNMMLQILKCTRCNPIPTTLKVNARYATNKSACLLTEMGEIHRQAASKKRKGDIMEENRQLQGTVEHLKTQLAVSETELAASKQQSTSLKTQLTDLRAELETSEQRPGGIVTDIITRMRASFMARINVVQNRFAHISNILEVIYLIQPPIRGDLRPAIPSYHIIDMANGLKTARLQHHPDKCQGDTLSLTISTEITKFLNCMQEEFIKRPDGRN
jgi:hypothetical protein